MECGECGSSIRDEARVCLSCGEIVRRRVMAADRLQAVPAGVPHWIAFDDPRGAEVGFYGASRVQRILAGLIDALILGAIAFALSLVVGREAATLNSDGTVNFDWVRIVPFVAIGAIYHIAFPASAWQATPGKKFIGLRVTTLEHERLTLVQAIGRWAALQVCFCIVFPLAAMVAVLGCIAVPLAFLILMGDGRSPWDAMAGTQVVD